MLRRYVLPCALILLVSIGAGGLAYKAQAKTAYSSACVFQAFIRLSREDPSTPEHQQFIAAAGLQEVDTVLTDVYASVGKDEKMPAGLVASETTTHPAPGLAVFAVTVTDPSPSKAISVANGVCNQYVTSITKHRADVLAAQVKTVQDRLDSIQAEVDQLQAIPASKLTPVQKVTLQTRKGQVIYNSQLMANLTSYPPDQVAVLSSATGTQKQQTGQLSKKLIIAGVAGVLVCFLYILIGEMIVSRGRSSYLYDEPSEHATKEPSRSS